MVDNNISPNSINGIAIDFGGSKISASRISMGKIDKNIIIPTNSMGNMRDHLTDIYTLIEKLNVKETDRLGVAVTGRVSSAGMWFSVNKKTLTSIKAFPLKDTLSEKYNREVNVMNDATAAAFGEYIAGNAKGYKRVGYITISTGIGGGFVFDGMPLLSESGLVSHIGFTTSRFAKDKCGSGRMQTVESIASGRAIEHIANKAGHTNINAKQIYKEFLSGQPWAEKIIKQSAAVIAELCGNIKATLDVDIILLGGSIGLADGYLSLVKKYLLEEPEVFMPQLNHSLLGVNASKIGVLYQGDT